MPILVPSTFYLLCVPAQKPKITESVVLAQTEIFFLAEGENCQRRQGQGQKHSEPYAHDTKKQHFDSTLRSREKWTLSNCSTEKAHFYRRTVTGVPSLNAVNTVQGLWRLLDGKTWSQQDKIFNGSKEDKLSCMLRTLYFGVYFVYK